MRREAWLREARRKRWKSDARIAFPHLRVEEFSERKTPKHCHQRSCVCLRVWFLTKPMTLRACLVCGSRDGAYIMPVRYDGGRHG